MLYEENVLVYSIVRKRPPSNYNVGVASGTVCKEMRPGVACKTIDFVEVTLGGYYRRTTDQGYSSRGGTPIFTDDVFEPVARVALYPTDEDGLGTCFGA